MLDRRGYISSTHRTNPLPFDQKLRKKKKYKKFKNVQLKKLQKQLMPYGSQPGQTRKAFEGNFHAICQNSPEIETNESHHSLFCKWMHQSDPYLKLAPFKMEEYSKDPFIVAIKDFLSPQEVQGMISLAEKKLELSQVGQGPEGSSKGDLEVRTSKQAWVPDMTYYWPHPNETYSKFEHILSDDPESIFNTPMIGIVNPQSTLPMKLTKRIETLTRMRLLSPYGSEDYQVANYGIGGQYNIHYDSSKMQRHSGMFPEVLFRCENVGRQQDFANFWHFLT